jgi:multiple sugar transport system substrate-binding protein
VVTVFRPLALGLESPESTRALQWFINLQLEYRVVPNAAQETAEASLSRFTRGQTAMLVETRRIAPSLRANAAFQWDVAPLPKFKGRRANVLLTDGYCLAAASQHPEAAWAFIEFASSPTGQTLLTFTGRIVPSLKTVAESPVFLDPNALPAHSQIWLDAIPSVRPAPVLKYWDDIERLTGEELRRAFYGEAPLTDAIQTAIFRTEDYFKLK